MSVPSADQIKKSFPEDPLDKIHGEPTYETIATLHRTLNSNASSVHTTAGGGNHGYLGLTINNASYITLTGAMFIPPTNPGPVPVIPLGQTGAQIAELERRHKENRRIFNEYSNVGTALKKQLIESVEDTYMRTMRHNVYGFAGTTVMQLLGHLYDAYGGITSTELAANDARLRTQVDISQPFEIFLAQVEDSIEYAEAGGTPYSSAQILSIAYDLMLNTGAFKDECKEWRTRVPANNKTWPVFRQMFGEAHKDLRRQHTTGNQGMSVINNANDMGSITSALEDLASATTADRTSVANLAEANAALTASFEQMKEMKEVMSSFTTMMLEMKKDIARINTTNTRKKPQEFNKKQTQWCWTHGCQKTHGSSTCERPVDGHQKDATLANMKGSSIDGMLKTKRG